MARNSLSRVMKLIEAEMQEQPAEKGFLMDLEKSIEITDQKEFVRGSNFYKPSSMNCIRQMYYTRLNVEPERDTSYQLIGICNNGTDTHLRIQTYISKMKDNGIDCEYVDVAEFVRSRELDYLEVVSQNGMETKLFHKDLKLSFLCDGIIKYKGIYYILELKTESSNKFWNREDVDPSHYIQGTCYSLSLGLDKVIFVYINRDNYEMKSFMFNVTSDMKHNITGLLLNCEQAVEEQKVPSKPGIERKTCAYCMYKEQCRKDG